MRRTLIFVFGVCFFILHSDSHAAQPLSPAEGDSLYHLHVLFRWYQISNSVCYHLQVAKDGSAMPFTDSLVTDLIDSTTTAIVQEGIEWARPYVWRVRGIDSTGTAGPWQPESHFATRAISPLWWSLQAVIYDSTQYYPGITIVDDQENPRPAHAVAVDMHGRPVWFAPPPTRSDQRLLNSGCFLALVGPEIQILTLNNEPKWHSNEWVFHHEVNPLPNGHYLSLIRNRRYVQTWGDSTLWDGDIIVEIDSLSDSVWSWNTFDHFSTLDFDSAALSVWPPDYPYDWTHSNACTYDSTDNAIYLSCRNLSRITKINRANGNIIWTMGARMASGQALFGDSLFWFQHAPQPLPAGHLLLYNNNNPWIPNTCSSAQEIAINFAWPETARVVWEYQQNDLSPIMGDVDRLPNGNTLITAGSSSYLLEVNAEGNEIWRLNTHMHLIYRAERLLSLFPQVFSVITPDQDLHLNSGTGSVSYYLHNEGTVVDTFHIAFNDLRGWFVSSNQDVILPGGSSAVLNFTYTAPLSNDPDTLYLNVVSSLNFESVDRSSVCVWTTPLAVPLDPAPPFNCSMSPNPFNQVLQIEFHLPTWENVVLTVHDVTGRQVALLQQGLVPPGQHTLTWNASVLASGIYVVRMETGDRDVVRKVMLLK